MLMANPLSSNPVPGMQLRDHRRYATTPGFLNHTPRDFEIKAARSALSARPGAGAMSFTSTYSPVQVSFGYLANRECPPNLMRVHSWHGADSDDHPRHPSPTPVLQRSKLLQPRDERASPDTTAVDMAYFLRDTAPPQVDLSDLESPIGEASTQKKIVRRMLKLGNSASSSAGLARGRFPNQQKPVNAVQKVSQAGTKYLQIVLQDPLPSTPANQGHEQNEQSSDAFAPSPPMDQPDPAHSMQGRDQVDCSNYTSINQQERDLVTNLQSESDDHDDTYGARSQGAHYHELSTSSALNIDYAYLDHGHELPQGLGVQTRGITPDSGVSLIHRKRSAASISHQSSDNEASGRSSVSRANTPTGQDEMRDVVTVRYLPLSAPTGPAPVKPLPPLPESRTTSPRASNVMQMICQNGQPLSAESSSTEHASNQGVRRTSREHGPIGIYDFPAAPSHIPARQQSLDSLTGKDASSTCVVQNRKSAANQIGPRAVRTRARKIRDLHKTRGSIDEMVTRSLDAPPPVVHKEMTPTEFTTKTTHTAISRDTVPVTSPNARSKPNSIRISPIMLVADQVPVPRPEERLSEVFQSILRQHHSPTRLTIPGSTNTPGWHDHQSNHSSPTNLAESDTHPAFRQRSPSPPDHSLSHARTNLYIDYRPSSRPPSRATTPLGTGSFQTSSSYRGTAPSPTLGKEPGLEGRIELLERENRLLDAALRAVLQTAGSLNGCPCGGRTASLTSGVHHERDGDVGDGGERKRESEASTDTMTSVDGSETSALDLYMSTRGSVGVVTGGSREKSSDRAVTR